ncbi:MAG: hypothetical protein ABIZ70_14480 [Gemmatimonadales bacterium]
MRLLLLLALLLRLAPASASMAGGEPHCARVEATAVHHASDHHGHPSAPASPDCPHCPPADCASQDQCTTAPALMALIVSTPADPWLEASAAAASHPTTLRSVIHTPPTRPPATLFA